MSVWTRVEKLMLSNQVIYVICKSLCLFKNYLILDIFYLIKN